MNSNNVWVCIDSSLISTNTYELRNYNENFINLRGILLVLGKHVKNLKTMEL